MIWPFSKKSKISSVPQKLVFKSGKAFFEYQCKFGYTDVIPQRGIVALVLDYSKEFGGEKAVKIEPDGRQMVALKVASDDGGFLVISTTPTGAGDRLKPDDVVIWLPVEYASKIIPKGADKRFGWVGFVIAKVKPEIELSSSEFQIACEYG